MIVLKKVFFLLFILSVIMYFFNDQVYDFDLVMKDSIYKIIYPKKENVSFSYDLNYSILLDENKKLKELLNLGETLSDYDLINASVLNVSDYLFGEFTINKGFSDGVDKGMAVICNSGLVGIIDSVYSNYSIVKYLDRYSGKISVKVESNDGFLYGVLYSSNGNFYVDGISSNVSILEGASVYTSGLSDKFVNGIYIGSVYNVELDNFELSRLLYVKSDVLFNSINYVAVVKGEAYD